MLFLSLLQPAKLEDPDTDSTKAGIWFAISLSVDRLTAFNTAKRNNDPK